MKHFVLLVVLATCGVAHASNALRDSFVQGVMNGSYSVERLYRSAIFQEQHGDYDSNARQAIERLVLTCQRIHWRATDDGAPIPEWCDTVRSKERGFSTFDTSKWKYQTAAQRALRQRKRDGKRKAQLAKHNADQAKIAHIKAAFADSTVAEVKAIDTTAYENARCTCAEYYAKGEQLNVYPATCEAVASIEGWGGLFSLRSKDAKAAMCERGSYWTHLH